MTLYSADAQPIFDAIAIAVHDERIALEALDDAAAIRNREKYDLAEDALVLTRRRISELSIQLETFRLNAE